MSEAAAKKRVQQQLQAQRMAHKVLPDVVQATCPVLVVSYDQHHRQNYAGRLPMIVYRDAKYGYYIFWRRERVKVTLEGGGTHFKLVLKNMRPWLNYEGDFE